MSAEFAPKPHETPHELGLAPIAENQFADIKALEAMYAGEEVAPHSAWPKAPAELSLGMAPIETSQLADVKALEAKFAGEEVPAHSAWPKVPELNPSAPSAPVETTAHVETPTEVAAEAITAPRNSNRILARLGRFVANRADRLANNASNSRTTSELGKEVFDNTVEEGRRVARNIGAAAARGVTTRIANTYDRVDAVQDTGKRVKAEVVKDTKDFLKAKATEARKHKQELKDTIKMGASLALENGRESLKTKTERARTVGKAALRAGGTAALFGLGAGIVTAEKGAKFTAEKAKLVSRDVKRAKDGAVRTRENVRDNRAGRKMNRLNNQNNRLVNRAAALEQAAKDARRDAEQRRKDVVKVAASRPKFSK